MITRCQISFIIAVVALVAVVARLFLLDIPEVFRFGKEGSEGVYDVGIGILSGFFPGILWVTYNRLRDEEAALGHEYDKHLRPIAEAGGRVLRQMTTVTEKSLPSDPTLLQVQDLCSAVDVGSTKPGPVRWSLAANATVPQTWFEYLVYEADRTAALHERVEPVYPLLPPHLVYLLRKSATAAYITDDVQLIRTTSLSNQNLGGFANSLHDYLEICNELRLYLEKEVKPILP